MFAEQIVVKCKKARWNSKNKLYNYQVREINLNSGEKKLAINQVMIDPTLPEQKFIQQFKYATDRFDVNLQQVRLVNLDIPSLLRGQVRADSLVSGKSNIHIYRDLSYPHDGKNRIGTYPHQMLHKLPVDLTIKKALFNNSFIEYKERNGKSEQSGKVQFYNADIRVNNLSNERQQLAGKNMQVQFNARFLNKAPVKALINFYSGGDGKFTIEGEMGEMSAKGINELTEPMGLAKVETGTISGLHFNFNGNDYAADGYLTLRYDDLKITLLKKDSIDNSLSKKKLASMMANIKVKNANPGKDGELRKASVHFKRDTHKSFFNLIWKSIFTGVKQSVGIE
jgi:hypothetical protein